MPREIMVPKHRRPSTSGDLIRGYQLANRLRVSRANLNAVVNGKRAVTPSMPMRLECLLGA